MTLNVNSDPITIDEVVGSTIRDMIEALETLGDDATAPNLEAALKPPIIRAYQRIHDATKSKEDNDRIKTKLYRKLSLIFAPDRLENSRPTQGSSDPTTPREQFSHAFERFLKQDETHIKIPQQVHLSNKDSSTDLLEQAMSGDNEAMTLLVTKIFEQLADIQQAHTRYIEPVQNAVGLIHALYIGLILTSAAVSTGVSGLALYLTTQLNRFLLNLVTENKYHEAVTTPITRAYMAEKARDILTCYNIDTEHMTDDEVMNQYGAFIQAIEARTYLYFEGIGIPDGASCDDILEIYNDQHPPLTPLSTTEEIEADFKTNLAYDINGIQHIFLVAQAFMTALSEPLPEDGYAIILSVLLRMTQATLMVPFLALTAAIELLNIALPIVILTTLAFAILSSITVMVITNLPLYVYDGLSMAIETLSTAIHSATSWMTQAPVLETSPPENNTNSRSYFDLFGLFSTRQTPDGLAKYEEVYSSDMLGIDP